MPYLHDVDRIDGFFRTTNKNVAHNLDPEVAANFGKVVVGLYFLRRVAKTKFFQKFLGGSLVQEGVELRGEMPNRYSQRHFKPFESLRIMILYYQETHVQNNFASDDE